MQKFSHVYIGCVVVRDHRLMMVGQGVCIPFSTVEDTVPLLLGKVLQQRLVTLYLVLHNRHAHGPNLWVQAMSSVHVCSHLWTVFLTRVSF